jgi:ElaB/YqjD/DUF883 family membrane-anchored ribosome-binding protein
MSDRPEGPIADAGEAVQQTINQAADKQDQVTRFVHDRPVTALLIALGIGYVLGKLT